MTGILTSVHGGYILAPTLSLAEFDGIEVATMRDVIVNNLAHSADQIGQVRVNWTSEVGAYYEVGTAPYDAAATWVRVCNLGNFPVNVRHDGKSYYMRVRVGLSSADSSTINTRLVINGRPYQTADANNGAWYASPLTNVTDLQHASPTAVWVDGGTVVLSASQVETATRPMAVANTTLATATYTTDVLRVYATLWAAPADMPNIRVHGCYIAEVLESNPAAEVA